VIFPELPKVSPRRGFSYSAIRPRTTDREKQA